MCRPRETKQAKEEQDSSVRFVRDRGEKKFDPPINWLVQDENCSESGEEESDDEAGKGGGTYDVSSDRGDDGNSVDNDEDTDGTNGEQM